MEVSDSRGPGRGASLAQGSRKEHFTSPHRFGSLWFPGLRAWACSLASTMAQSVGPECKERGAVGESVARPNVESLGYVHPRVGSRCGWSLQGSYTSSVGPPRHLGTYLH